MLARFKFLVIVTICGIFNCAAASSAKQYVTFREYNIPGCGISVSETAISENSLDSRSSYGNDNWINISFENNVPDSIRRAINHAKKMWERKLSDAKPVYVVAEMAPLSNEIALETAVSYCGGELIQGCTGALASQISGNIMGAVDSPDAIITLNSDLSWNCSTENTQQSGFNVTTMALRGFARCFGFGSCLRPIEGQTDGLEFETGFPSRFDLNILNRYDGLVYYLNSSRKYAFLTDGRATVKGKNAKYPLYTPSPFDYGKSVVYLSLPTSLMHYDIGVNDKFISIDNATLDILNQLGWSFVISAQGNDIECSDITNNGVVSAYTQPSFSIKDRNELGITEYNWNLSVRGKDGKYSTCLVGNDADFTLPEITSADAYLIDSEGMLDAILECDYIAGGQTYSAQSRIFNIDMKPIITSVHDIVLTPGEEYTYTISFTVEYRGANKISVALREETNDNIRRYDFNQPLSVNVVTGRVDQWGKCWVEIEAKNIYGTAKRRLDFPVYSDLANAIAGVNAESEVSDSHITIYTLQGRVAYEGAKSDFHVGILSAGIYIYAEQCAEEMRTSKIVVQ